VFHKAIQFILLSYVCNFDSISSENGYGPMSEGTLIAITERVSFHLAFFKLNVKVSF